ncbi:MAG TPA: DNA translocase FtsK, partial [Planctomycetota bacterium]|nr:DNA translocase FtsK [Planctomycetota bacterium]
PPVHKSQVAAAAAAGRPVPTAHKGPPPRIGTTDEPNQLTNFGEPFAPTPVGPLPYTFPGEDLLDKQETVDQEELDELLAAKTETLEKTLESFKIEARCVEIQKGPVISMFEMELGPGIKVERVRSLEDDLAIALKARTVRIVAPIPGKNTIGIEVPNPLREVVRMKPLLRCKEYTDGKYALPIFLGRDASGAPMIVDLAKMPHLLVAGATGSGKSVCLNSVLASFLYTRTPEQVKLILIDPKMVELSQFANAPHLACPVISDMKRAPGILDWAIVKMEERYKLLSQAGQRNIYGYNKLGKDGLRPHFAERVDDPEFPHFLPFIVIVIDELADLMLTAAKEVETSITRLAAKSRAVGIHLIVATQRPSTNVITGLIKANLPTRIGFMVSSKIDSRVILDENGAEQLLGEGDMLVMSPASTSLVRGQGAYLSEEEVRRIMEHVKTAGGPAYVPELVQRKGENSRDPDEEDELYDAAARFIFSTERGSASLLQRKFAIGYTRASRLIDMMAEEGVLGEFKGSQARELTMTLPDWIALKPDKRGAPAEGEFDASHAAADQGGADPRGAAGAGAAAEAEDAADEADAAESAASESEELETRPDDQEPRPPKPEAGGKGKRRKG